MHRLDCSIVVGMVPVKELNSTRLYSKIILDGIIPLNEISLKLSLSKFDNKPISVGIVPVNECDKERLSKVESKPILDGMIPCKLFRYKILLW